LRQVESLVGKDGEVLAEVILRYGSLFRELDGAFDGGWAPEDVDVAVLTVSTLIAEEAAAAVAMLLADFKHYAAARKHRQGEDVLLIVDEFSRLEPGQPGGGLGDRGGRHRPGRAAARRRRPCGRGGAVVRGAGCG
jgi:hypothetical protein